MQIVGGAHAGPKITHILEKFETTPGLLHTYYAAQTGALVFELPRFDLSFELGALSPELPGRGCSSRACGKVHSYMTAGAPSAAAVAPVASAPDDNRAEQEEAALRVLRTQPDPTHRED